MDFSFSDFNFSAVKNRLCLEAHVALTVNSQSVPCGDTDIVPTNFDDSLTYLPWGNDNQMPFDILWLIKNIQKIKA